MARKLTAALFLLLAGLITAGDSRAEANWWWGGAPFGINRMYRSDREIPYFAEHPPVYYSYIVPRTYGQSPYAYWPGPFTPTLTPEPIMVSNPYIPAPEEVPARPSNPRKRQTSTDKNVNTQVSGGPLVVLNPYVTERPAIASQAK